MDRFLWPRNTTNRQRGLSRSSSDITHDHVSSERIEKKKKVVSDLMALRRMKLKQNSKMKSPTLLPLTGPSVEEDSSPLHQTHLQPLLENTALKEELDKLYGKEALTKATEHFSQIMLKGEHSDAKEETDKKRFQFLETLLQKDRGSLEKERQQRLRKQQSLIDKQVELKLQEKFYNAASHESLYDDLPQLVSQTKQNLKMMEENLRLLKKRYARDISSLSAEKLNKEAYKIFKANHPQQIEIVSPIIDSLLENVVQQAAASDVDPKLLEMLLTADQQQYEELQATLVKSDAALAILDNIVQDTLPVLIKDICEECIFLARMTIVYPEDAILASTNLTVAREKKNKKTPGQIVEDTFVSIKSSRENFRSNLWNHTQLAIKEEVQIVTDAPVAKTVTPQPQPVIDSGAESEAISSENSTPKLDSRFGRSVEMKIFAAQEADMWKSFIPDSPEFSVTPKPVLGISVTCLTSDHRLVAAGSYRGDILVYDLLWEPFRLVRCVAFRGKINDAIVSVHWSLDNSRLVTLSANGCVVVWSVSYAPYVSISDVKLLDFSQSIYNSQQLTALCVLETAKGDFKFQGGSLPEGSTQLFLPQLVSFHPSLSIAATQDSIVVVLSNGDILKCNLFETIQNHCKSSIIPEMKPVNHDILHVLGLASVKTEKVLKIGQDVKVELFRFHRHELLKICFMSNGGDMISLDSSLNLCQWKHDPMHLNSFGWFTPFKKFTLSFLEEVFTAKGEDDVLFEDIISLKKSVKGKKTKSKKAIDTERRRVLRDIENSRIDEQEPWYTDEFPDELEENRVKAKKPSKFITRIYAPPSDQIIDTAAGGATFTVLTLKREDGLLVKFAYRRYESSTNTAVTLLQSEVPSAGDRMHFMLLYDEHLPKVRKHVSFTELNLETMQLGKVGPIQIDISADSFIKCKEENTASFSVSRVNQPSSTDYIVSNICGDISIRSLLSGRAVVQRGSDRETFKPEGLLYLPPRFIKVTAGSRVLYIKPDGETSYILILPLLLDKSSVTNKVLKISEGVVPQKRALLQSAFKSLVAVKNQFSISSNEPTEIGWFNSEQVCLRETWTRREMPASLYMQLLLNTIVDVVLARVTGVRMPQDTRKKIWQKDWLEMERYFS